MTDFLIVLLGALAGCFLASILVIYFIKRNFFKPKLYFKQVQILPTKGDMSGDQFAWGGLVFTGELQNDSDYWAYNVRIDDVYAEYLPMTKTVLLPKTPLRLVSDLPKTEDLIDAPGNTQLINIKPGDKITTSIRILTKKSIPISDYKKLIQELRMIQIKTRVLYENSAGYKSNTYFWLDFHYVRFINLFSTRPFDTQIWKNPKRTLGSPPKITNKIVDVDTRQIS